MQEGMFGLREWEDEGFTPQAQDADDPSYDPVQTVRTARQPSARVTSPPLSCPGPPAPPPSFPTSSAPACNICSCLIFTASVCHCNVHYHAWAVSAMPAMPAMPALASRDLQTANTVVMSMFASVKLL